MNDEPGTRWKRSFQEYAAAKASEAAESATELPNFKPTCLDCAYDLTGLDDGICPECGHGFTRKRLLAAHHARMKQRKARIGYLWHLPLAITYVPLFASFHIDGYFGFIIDAVAFAIVAIFWYLVNRDRFIEGAHWLLALQIPLLFMGLGIATVEHGMYGVVGVLVIMSIVSMVALRGSPLTSSFILKVGGVIPMGCVAALLLIESTYQLAQGHYWSYFDYPAFPRWRAFTAANALKLGFALLAFAVVTRIGIAAVAKRAQRQLTHQSALRAARESPSG